MSVLLKKLNHYSRYTQVDINNIIAYVNTKNNPQPIFPANFNARQQQRYIEKFGEDFVVNNNTLFYNPNNDLNLEVVPPALRQQRLQGLYNNFQQGLGLGINSFYHQVCSHYLGITRAETTTFLKNQGDYQVGHPYVKRVNKPIVVRCSNERWGVDLIDLNFYLFRDDPPTHNNRYRYILLIVDYFSKKVFGRALRNKTAIQIRNAINQICVGNNTYPHIIQADNEFHNPTMNNWANQHHVTLIKTKSFSPNSNGLIERMNQEMWKRVRAGFIRTNSLEWETHLQDYIININNQRHGKTKYAPDRIWVEGYNPPPANQPIIHHIDAPNDHMNNNEIQERIQSRLIRNAEREIQRQNPDMLQVGDHVRVAMSQLEGQVRRRIKDGRFKTISVRYSPEIYTIVAFFQPVINNFNINRRRYTLSDENDDVVMEGVAPKEFYANQLIRVPDNFTPSNVPDRNRANQINRTMNY